MTLWGFPHSSVGKESAYNAGDPDLIPGSGRSTGERIGYLFQYSWASLVSKLVKNPPAMWEIWVRSMGWEDLLEKGKTTHSSILAWRIPWNRKESDTSEQLSLFIWVSLTARFPQKCSRPLVYLVLVSSNVSNYSQRPYPDTVFKPDTLLFYFLAISSTEWRLSSDHLKQQVWVASQHPSSSSFLKIIYFFIFGCAGSSLLWELFSSCSKQGLLLAVVWGFSLWWLLWATREARTILYQQTHSLSEEGTSLSSS